MTENFVAGPDSLRRRFGLSTRDVIFIAIWFGLLVGLIELAMIPALKPLRDSSPGFFRLNRHSVWMVPIVDFCLFLLLGLMLAFTARVHARLSTRFAFGVLCFFAALIPLVSYPRLFLFANLALAAGLAYRLSGRIDRNLAGFSRIVRVSLPWLALVSAAFAGPAFYREVLRPRSTRPTTPLAGPNQPNVMLIVLDTVRADRLSLHGHDRPTSPNLERWAKSGIRFDEARSTAPWTLPSHASMMTGRWPHQLTCDINTPLDSSFPTIAEYLKGRGYSTAGFVANLNYTGAETGLGRGFDLYVDHDISPLGALRTTALGKQVIWPIVRFDDALTHRDALLYRKDAREINRQTLSWIDRRPKDRPFFAFLNFYDVHDPYLTPDDHKHRFGERPTSRADLRLFHEWFLRDKERLGERERALMNDAYDECIAYLDERLDELLKQLESRGVLDQTLVIITADHGEHLGSHGLFGHASSLYSEETRVPLLILPPKSKGVRGGIVVDDPVSLREIAATIADFVDPSDRTDSPFPGKSLAAYWSAPADVDVDAEPRRVLSSIDQPVPAAPNHGRSPVFRGAMNSIVIDDYLYILNGDGIEELYDTSKDPRELENLAGKAEVKPVLVRCRESLRLALGEHPQGSTTR